MSKRQRDMKYITTFTIMTILFNWYMVGYYQSGELPRDIHPYFWQVESILMAFRAIVEGWHIIYINSTKTVNNEQDKLLTRYKIISMVLIVLIGTPIVAANAWGVTIINLSSNATASTTIFIIWAFAISVFSPVILSSVSYAYKVQPNDNDELENVIKELNEYKNNNDELLKNNKQFNNTISELKNSITKIETNNKKLNIQINHNNTKITQLEQIEKQHNEFLKLFNENKMVRGQAALKIKPMLDTIRVTKTTNKQLAELLNIPSTYIKDTKNGTSEQA